jgi:serine/threonine-protein kinase PknK
LQEDVSLIQGPANLPLEVTTFVGRKSERGRISELMSGSRLVTLTGFGGVGKTRLALRVANERRRAFDGVYVVTLGGVVDPQAVPEQVAATLGLRERPAESTVLTIVEYLRPRTVLLVLDNCEHVVEQTALIAEDLLRTCPGVHILATSREPLRIDGEVEYRVSPLTIPREARSDEPLTGYEAVQLFLDRARSVTPDFTLTDDNRADVAGIINKLEGIPLALELAAARLRMFSPTELNEHLTDQWELLGRGSRTAPYRHSTMGACIEWSFDLCTPAERLLWAKASTFVDGFDVDAAAAVCFDPDDEPIVQTLASLVEKSVLTVSAYDGATRYRMLPPIRDRGRVELTRMGRSADAARRHKDYFLTLVARSHDEWFGPQQLDWIYRLRREAPNIAAALDLCASQPEYADAGLKAGSDLLNFGLVEGRFQQGRRWFDRILRTRPGDSEIRARALRTAGLWAAMQGDFRSATSLIDEGRTLANRVGGDLKALFVHADGFVALYTGDLRRSEQLLGEAADAFLTSGDQGTLAHSLTGRALSRLLLGDIEGALADHRACLEITEPAGEIWLKSWSLWIAALALWMGGDPTAAKQHAAQSLRGERNIGESFGIVVLLETLALFSAATDPRKAATLLGAAQNDWDRIDTTARILPALEALHSESTESARAHLGEAGYEAAWDEGRNLDRASAIALALGEQPPQSVSTPVLGPGAPHALLTKREQQISELIHKGLTNKEIAASLVISPRTAESHVEHILAKLGFTSRTQVAAWYADQHGDGGQ